MASPIDKSQYITLGSYAVLAAGNLTGPATVNGLYYGYGNTLTGAVSGPATLNTSDMSTALTQLTALTGAIAAIATTATLSPTMTLAAGTRYTVSANTAITASDVLTFDAAGDPDAQFFIDASGFTLSVAGTFALANGAKSNNVFVVADEITLSADTVGTFIGGPITAVGAIEMEGQLLSHGAGDTVLVDSSPTITSFAAEPAPITQSAYLVMNGYSVISAGNINGPTVDGPAIVNGLYYGYGVGLTGDITGVATLNNTDLSAALAEATALSDACAAILPTAPLVTDASATLVPGVRYFSSTAISLQIDDILTFDAMGDSDAQFFVHVDNSLIVSSVFNLVNGAQPKNIYVICSGLDMVATASYGTFIITTSNLFIGSSATLNARLVVLKTNRGINILRQPIITGLIEAAPIAADYFPLREYTVLAAGNLTVPATLYGLYYGYGGTLTGSPISGSAALNTSDMAAALTQLSTLVSNIEGVPITASLATTMTILAGVRYTASGNISLTASDVLTFDAAGDSSAQFFVDISGYTLSISGTLVLANGAQASNIFIVADEITVNADTLGVFIGGPVTVVGATTINGQLFSRGASDTVTIDENPIIIGAIPVSPITKASYPTLFSYAVLAAGNLTGPATVNGLYYGYGDTLTGAVSGPATLNTGDMSTALTELTALTGAIAAIAPTATLSPTMTLAAGTRYTVSANTVITASDVLTFDAAGDPDAQFFIDASGFTLSVAGTFALANGAKSNNVFVVADEITLSADTVGTFIGGPITAVGAIEMEGQLLSHGAGDTVLVDSSPTITSFATEPAPITQSAYSVMNGYSVLAAGNLTGPATVNGLYYGYGNTLIDVITGQATLNNADLSIALAEGTALFDACAAILPTAPLLTDASATLVPGVRYYSSTAISLQIDDILTFDAMGDPDAQFFVHVTNNSFVIRSACILVNGAQPKNIYIICAGVQLVNVAAYGTIIANGGAQIIVNGAPTLTARLVNLLSNRNIVINTLPTVTGLIEAAPIAPDVFPLRQYTALAAGNLTVPATLNGMYYGYGGTLTGSPVSGSATLNANDVAAALTQLSTLVSDIEAVSVSTTLTPTMTLMPGVRYTATSNISLTASDVLTFDAAGDSSAQFFVCISGFTLTIAGTLVLANGAQTNNIFIVADELTMSADTLGVFIGGPVTVVGATTIKGQLFSLGAGNTITIDENPIVTGAIPVSPITKASFVTLNSYAVLAAGNLTGPATVNGLYYGYGNTLTGAVSGIAALNTSDMSTALTQLTALTDTIAAIGFTLPLSPTMTPQAGVVYTASGNTVITASDVVTFDAAGDPDAQFFIDASGFTLSVAGTFVLANGAKSSNIFVVADEITLSADSVGAFIGGPITVVGALEVEGQLLSQGAGDTILVNSNPTITSFATEPVPITQSDYSTLNSYSVLAAGNLTGPATVNGLYYGYGVTLTGVISGLATLNATDLSTAVTEGIALFDACAAILPTAPLVTDASTTLVPGVRYFSSTAISLQIDDILTFDAMGDPDAQFFVHVANNSFVIRSVFNLVNGAQAKNVYIIHLGIQIVNVASYGTFINAVNGANTIVNGGPTLTARLVHLRSNRSITINQNPTVTGLIEAAPVATNEYLPLRAYTVLAAGNLAVPATLNGLFYGYGGALTGSPISGTAALNTSDLPTALTQLTTLVSDIEVLPTTAPLAATMTLVAGVRYTVSADISLTASDVLTFDAAGDSSAQFFVDISGFTLSIAGTMVLANGAQASNIFVLADEITVSADTLGVFIGGPVTVVGATTISGQLFSRGAADAVTIDENPVVNGFVDNSPIIQASYSTLNTYSVLAAGSITGPASVNGLYYGYVDTLTGAISGTATLNTTDIAAALGELATLSTDVASIPITALVSGSSLTLLPGVRYTVSSTITLDSSSILTFDALGDPTAQFFVQVEDASSLTIGSAFQLANGARFENIYVVGSQVSIAGAVGGTFALDTITVIGAEAVMGRLLSPDASQTITIDGSPGVYAPPASNAPLVLSSYSTLLEYEAIAAGDITGPATVNGVHYGTSGAVTGTISGTATFNTTDVATALTQLSALRTDVGDLVYVAPFPDAPTTLSPGILYTVPATISSALTLDASDDPDAQFFLVPPASTTLTIQASITLANGAQAQNVFIVNNGGDVLVDNDTNGNIVGEQITVSGARTVEGRVMSYGLDPLLINENPTINNATICFLAGSKLLTLRGYVAVETIQPGDQVVTMGRLVEGRLLPANRQEGLATVKWVGKFVAPNLDSKTLPVRIRAGALGPSVPFEDLLVSPGHGVLGDGDWLRLAINMVNGTSIVQDTFANHRRGKLEYWHIEFDQHMVVLANGAPTESYDAMPVNRRVFTEQLSVDFATAIHAESECASVVQA